MDTKEMQEANQCPIEATLNLIAGKWKALVLCYLSMGTSRYNEIKRAFPRVTQKMLTQQLRELEADGLIIRTVFAQVPPKVEYTLTPFGESLLPVIKVMGEWGKNHLSSQGESAGCGCRCRS
jgi:DNA-binding HxlR family transcriptional regulator